MKALRWVREDVLGEVVAHMDDSAPPPVVLDLVAGAYDLMADRWLHAPRTSPNLRWPQPRKELLAAYCARLTYKKVGDLVGLSPSRVQQIVDPYRQDRAPGPAWFLRVDEPAPKNAADASLLANLASLAWEPNQDFHEGRVVLLSDPLAAGAAWYLQQRGWMVHCAWGTESVTHVLLSPPPTALSLDSWLDGKVSNVVRPLLASLPDEGWAESKWQAWAIPSEHHALVAASLVDLGIVSDLAQGASVGSGHYVARCRGVPIPSSVRDFRARGLGVPVDSPAPETWPVTILGGAEARLVGMLRAAGVEHLGDLGALTEPLLLSTWLQEDLVRALTTMGIEHLLSHVEFSDPFDAFAEHDAPHVDEGWREWAIFRWESHDVRTCPLAALKADIPGAPGLTARAITQLTDAGATCLNDLGATVHEVRMTAGALVSLEKTLNALAMDEVAEHVVFDFRNTAEMKRWQDITPGVARRLARPSQSHLTAAPKAPPCEIDSGRREAQDRTTSKRAKRYPPPCDAWREEQGLTTADEKEWTLDEIRALGREELARQERMKNAEGSGS